jgi:hypothetical protein
MVCQTERRLAIELTKAKDAVLLAETGLHNDAVSLGVMTEERSNAKHMLRGSRMSYVEHKAMCSSCIAEIPSFMASEKRLVVESK